MTLRLLAPLLLLSPLTACDRPAPPPQPEPRPQPATAFANTEASQSIMQPKVIAEIKPEPAPVVVPEPAALPSVTIAFESGAALDDAARGALDALLADTALPEGARFILRGSSDSQGSNAANLATSRRRADAVKAYLVEKGVDDDRITMVALGDHRPVAPNVTLEGEDDPAGRARNRRVDVETKAPDPDSASDLPAAAT